MNMRLRPITADHLAPLERMEAAFGQDLRQYQSRLRPYRWQEQLGTPSLIWQYIEVDDVPVGCIWLEWAEGVAAAEGESASRLGIFLADPQARGKGIGAAAVRQLLTVSSPLTSRVQLHVRRENQRAIRCYQSCGFSLIQQEQRPNGQWVHTMEWRRPC